MNMYDFGSLNRIINFGSKEAKEDEIRHLIRKIFLDAETKILVSINMISKPGEDGGCYTEYSEENCFIFNSFRDAMGFVNKKKEDTNIDIYIYEISKAITILLAERVMEYGKELTFHTEYDDMDTKEMIFEDMWKKGSILYY